MEEVPLENANETIEHHAHHSSEKWVMGVALSAAIFAALAAITSLLGEHHAQEAMLLEIKASDKWNQYQADSIKAKVVDTKMEMLESLGKEISKTDRDKIAKYDADKEKIGETAKEFTSEAESHLKHHEPLSRALTMFQVSIAIGAISVLTQKRAFWFVSMVVGAIGVFFLGCGVMF